MNQQLEKYRTIVSNPPAAGDILTTYSGSPVLLTVQVEDGHPPFIFGRAYINELMGESLGWYLRGDDDDKAVGWKCVLMTKARREVAKRCGDQFETGFVRVKSLKVVRASESGNSLLCEVHEYLPEEPTGEGMSSDPTDRDVPSEELKIGVPDAEG